MKNTIIAILVVLVLGLGGYLVYDKVIDKNKEEIKNEDDNKIFDDLDSEEITVEELVGTYTWEKNYTNTYGNEYKYKITLVLNLDGTATYYASSGYEEEATRGSYVYQDGIIIYTREYYNYSDQNNNQIEVQYPDENNNNEIFIIVDKNTLITTYYNQKTLLNK